MSFIYAATRTPFGKYGGALSGVRPDDLGAAVIADVLAKLPGLDPAAIDDVVFGNANGAGEDNRNVARMLVSQCDYPLTAPACVSTVYTDYAIFDVTNAGVVVRESFSLSIDELQSKVQPVELQTVAGVRRRGPFRHDTGDSA